MCRVRYTYATNAITAILMPATEESTYSLGMPASAARDYKALYTCRFAELIFDGSFPEEYLA